MSLKIGQPLIEQSIENLKASIDKEKVLLWLGKRLGENYVADEVFTPMQTTEEDYFHISEEGMDNLMNKLRANRKMIVAQIHTHPREAFHSLADDRWAIVRHMGAYSLVLPYFASTTTTKNFLNEVAIFALNEFNAWKEVDNSNIIII
jgi:hypothetical protein